VPVKFVICRLHHAHVSTLSPLSCTASDEKLGGAREEAILPPDFCLAAKWYYIYIYVATVLLPLLTGVGAI